MRAWFRLPNRYRRRDMIGASLSGSRGLVRVAYRDPEHVAERLMLCYINYLWQEARMSLRTAALFGLDPTALRTTAEMLTLRGIHPTVDAAQAALTSVLKRPHL